MNSSTATQLDFFVGSQGLSGERTPFSARSTASELKSGIDFPQFGGYSGVKAQTTRIAARLIAATVTEPERKALLAERKLLIDKVLSKTISRRETIRLKYVRWSLDRIEDARHGQDFDRLEDSIARYEHFLSELDEFKTALDRASVRRR